MELTTKLFNTGIRVTGRESFELDGKTFTSVGLAGTRIESTRPQIQDLWLVTLVNRLFDVGFLAEVTDGVTSDIDRLVEALRMRSIFNF